jgi:hypothetical protein
VQVVQLLLALAVVGPLGWGIVRLIGRVNWPINTVLFIAELALVLILLSAVLVTIFRVLVIRYWPLHPSQVDQLRRRTLCHYTTAARAAAIMGVPAIPPGGVTGTAQLHPHQPGTLTIFTSMTGGRSAVFAYAGPLPASRRHRAGFDTVVEFSGTDLPDLSAVRWHPNGALRIAGGYTGPATARPRPSS